VYEPSMQMSGLRVIRVLRNSMVVAVTLLGVDALGQQIFRPDQTSQAKF
jgi:hypothetical protein